MKSMRWLVPILLLAARPAWPCGERDVSPRARVVGDADAPGLQPWIATSYVTPTNVTMMVVADTCVDDALCEGQVVDFNIVGDHIRPAMTLPAGTRLQISYGTEVLADFTLQTERHAPALPAWEGVELTGVTYQPSYGQSIVNLKVAPTSASLANTVLLFYTARPEPVRPLANVFQMQAGVREGNDVDIGVPGRSRLGIPLQLWVVLSDGHGQLSVPQKIL